MREKLSVIIPNYNHGHFLKDLLPSLFTQSRLPDEVIIVDDGSTDASVAIIEAFQRQEKRVQLFKNGTNKGVVFSLNFALSKAKGDWVTFPSADNFVLPGMYEKCLHFLQDHPQAAVCCSDPVIFHEISGIKERRILHLSKIAKYFSPKETVALSAKTGFSIGSLVHTVIVKKTALQEVGYFIEKLRWHCDFFALNSVAFRYGFCYIPEELAMFRDAPQSYSAKSIEWKVRKKVYQDLIAVLNLPKNKDIKIAFKKSAILGEFTYSMLSVLISNPLLYEYFTFRLSKRLLHSCSWPLLRKICKGVLPTGVYGFLKKMLK